MIAFTDKNDRIIWLSKDLRATCIRRERDLTHIFFSRYDALSSVYVKESVSVAKAIFGGP